jgi:hypothetical protein
LLMPEPQRTKWFIFNRTTGGIILLAVILIGQGTQYNLLGFILQRPAFAIVRFLLGI